MIPSMNTEDVIIIGSGFGGAMVAARLAEAGLRVAIFEKGVWHGEAQGHLPFPKTLLGMTRALHSVDLGCWGMRERRIHRRGFFELHRLPGLAGGKPDTHTTPKCTRGLYTLSGVGMGGSSLVYGGITQDPAEDFFDAFPLEISRADLASRFARAKAWIGPAACPTPSTRSIPLRAAEKSIPRSRFVAFEQAIRWDEAHRHENVSMEHPPRTSQRPHGRHKKASIRPSNTCTHCNLCSLGCNRGAKKSLDQTLLLHAMRHGAVAHPLHEVRYLRATDGGFAVGYVNLSERQPRIAERTARRVVLAAGALHTHKILFRSRALRNGLPKLSDALGHGFSVGGDCLRIYRGGAYAMNYAWGHNAEAGLVVHDTLGRRDHVVFPSEIPFTDAWWLRPFKTFLDHTLLLVGIGRDDANGILSWRDDHLEFSMPVQGVLGRSFATMNIVAQHYGVSDRILRTSNDRPASPWATVHPIGGCRIASSPRDGLVDFRGEVFGYPGLFIADASILPASPVAAPSLSVAALALHVAESMLETQNSK